MKQIAARSSSNSSTSTSRRNLSLLKIVLTLVSSYPCKSLATIQCNDTPCGTNRVQICHFNGKEFQTLCIRQNSVLRKPNNHHSSAQDYCGPCTSHKPFESSEELKGAISQYISQNHYNAELATTYGWPMNNWNVTLITDFSELFANSNKNDKKSSCRLNEDLSSWDTARATNMDLMFWQCNSFENGGLWRWDVSRVTSMERMFLGATKFNADLSTWTTSRVTSLMGMFWKAQAFNAPIGEWDTSSVVDASRTFAEATSFDQDITSWATTRMMDLSYMFLQATSFTHQTTDLSKWDLSNALTLERMLYRVPSYERAPAQQDVLLETWNQQWKTAGRSMETINTDDLFSSCQDDDEQQKEMEIPSPYMRGNKHIFSLKTTRSFKKAKEEAASVVLVDATNTTTTLQEQEQAAEDEEESNATTNPASTSTSSNSTSPCPSGVCPTH